MSTHGSPSTRVFVELDEQARGVTWNSISKSGMSTYREPSNCVLQVSRFREDHFLRFVFVDVVQVVNHVWSGVTGSSAARHVGLYQDKDWPYTRNMDPIIE